MRVIVIGGGPAGMMAAGVAAEVGADIVLIEKNEKLGKKLHITGKGRCNLTNDTDVRGLLEHTNTNSRFLNSAFHAFDARAAMDFFERRGLALKTERGNRVFPQSDRADDVNKTLAAWLREVGVKVKLNTAVQGVEVRSQRSEVRGRKLNPKQDSLFHVVTNDKIFVADAVIIATGGLSYPSTGSTGDGFTFAKKLGHTVTETHPALVPLVCAEEWITALEGLSLRNVNVTARLGSDAAIYKETGEMIFTANGVSGPLILTASAFLCDKFASAPTLSIDLKPALSPEQLDARILRDFSAAQNKYFANALDELLPKRLIETVIALSEIPPQKKVNEITRAERQRLVTLLKALPLTPTGTEGFKQAVITRGGVNVLEINPSTLMSKKIPGLFFAGEVLDTDAMTGGYNMQIAFSTGWLAGVSAAEVL